ncbi:NADPH-dependent oxidoreductase [Vagococcus vulneris]|uniref:NADPH-dependent oxidoreductase n=1 Tax=Vagococcus vulneris TaxID=1977869 RepID=A0A429ZZ59_9ENTE|nr:NADPH-dependent oxidoreductase [Vagococcus vulneris]RST99298.1 NADPH-dependent oxidoreductase [Vagococcus vulneris]
MNETVKTQLNHKSIRKFKIEKLSDDTIEILTAVARHTATSNFMQSYSIVCLTDKKKMQALSEICNQHYVAEASHVFVFVADQHRNQQIAKENQQETSVLTSMDRFMLGMTDACLAAQNVNLAAESMGIGTVFLGSILNDARGVIELLNLPKKTFPILGLAFGYPDQEPQLKPRLPKEVMFFDNEYKVVNDIKQELSDYDTIVTDYYDLRDANKRIDSFTKQITDGMSRRPAKRMDILKEVQKQGLLLD